MNETIETIKSRRSVRSYEDRPITKEVMMELIDCARLAPTARGEQHWEFIVITDKEKLQKITSIADYGSFIADAAACVLVMSEGSKYYLEDGCAATENILLAARSLGIGSCWVAGDKKPYCSKILELVKAPADYKLVSILSLGYSSEQIEARGKRSLNEVLRWEEF
jgi:nitroreductase